MKNRKTKKEKNEKKMKMKKIEKIKDGKILKFIIIESHLQKKGKMEKN